MRQEKMQFNRVDSGILLDDPQICPDGGKDNCLSLGSKDSHTQLSIGLCHHFPGDLALIGPIQRDGNHLNSVGKDRNTIHSIPVLIEPELHGIDIHRSACHQFLLQFL